MNETSKTRRLWNDFHQNILKGQGIDIGCGPDPILPHVRRFDVEDGDANHITKYVHEQFDFVYSSHCLEHMRDPRQALREWWQLVRPGGHLFFIVPDEDLYEQGVFPSRFNPDHKATFSIAKNHSWSPVSVNLLEEVRALPDGELVSIELQDNHYDRALLKHGAKFDKHCFLYRKLRGAWRRLHQKTGCRWKWLEAQFAAHEVVDQTLQPEPSAQIQCIVRKHSRETAIPQ